MFSGRSSLKDIFLSKQQGRKMNFFLFLADSFESTEKL